MERPVSYYSEGARLSAVLYVPDGAGPSSRTPGIVLCHGFTGIKELILPDYARHFAAEGYVALAFDYRGFGESEGERGRLIPSEQVRDIRNSITFMETLDQADPERIGLWGTSYGAANVIQVAGIDLRPKCTVAQVGFGDGGRGLSRRSSEETAPIMAAISNERKQRVLTGKGMQESMVERLTLAGDLQRAVERGDFVVHYQLEIELSRRGGSRGWRPWCAGSTGAGCRPRSLSTSRGDGADLPIGGGG